MSHVFISYSRLDRDYVLALAETLKDEFELWIDDHIEYGDEWPQVIQEKLDNAAAVIVIMTPRAAESKWVQSELRRAQRKEKPVFPLLLEGEPWLPVESIHYVDVTDGRMPPVEFRSRLKKALGSGLRLHYAAAAKALKAKANDLPGLRSRVARPQRREDAAR